MNNDLNIAVFKNDIEEAKNILKNKTYVDINEKNQDGTNPLIYSLSQKNYDMAYILLEHGADTNVFDRNKKSVLHYAVELNDYGIIKKIVNTKPNLEHKDALGRTPLHLSVFLGYINSALLLIESGASVKTYDKNHCSLLHTICQHGDNQFLDMLLSMELDINALDINGMSPIFYAAIFNQAITVIFLLKRDADDDIVLDNGNNVFLVAAENGSKDVIEALISMGLDINYTNFINETALHLAIKSGDLNTILSLLKHGIDTNINSKHGTVLHEAVAINSPEIISFLMLYGVNSNLLDRNGNNAFHRLAMTLGHIEVKQQCIDLLIKYGCDINKKNKDGNTAMHFAASVQDKYIMKALVHSGAKQSVKNNAGIMPQDLFGLDK